MFLGFDALSSYPISYQVTLETVAHNVAVNEVVGVPFSTELITTGIEADNRLTGITFTSEIAVEFQTDVSYLVGVDALTQNITHFSIGNNFIVGETYSTELWSTLFGDYPLNGVSFSQAVTNFFEPAVDTLTPLSLSTELQTHFVEDTYPLIGISFTQHIVNSFDPEVTLLSGTYSTELQTHFDLAIDPLDGVISSFPTIYRDAIRFQTQIAQSIYNEVVVARNINYNTTIATRVGADTTVPTRSQLKAEL